MMSELMKLLLGIEKQKIPVDIVASVAFQALAAFFDQQNLDY